MFELVTDSEFLFNYLNNYFNNSVQFIDEEYFIINNKDTYLIIYHFPQNSKELIGFKIISEEQILPAGLQLLSYLEELSATKSPIFLKAAEAWHQFLLNLKSDKLFFDAH